VSESGSSVTARAERNEGILSFGEKVGYSLGDAASNFYWKTFEFYILAFYTDVFGISAAAAGTMMLVTRLLDAVVDPVMGTLADRTRTRWGHFRPYLVWFAFPLAVAGVMTFTTPDLGHDAKVVYAYVTYTILMLLYTAVNIPYSALMGVMTPNSKERTALSSFRFIGAFTVTVIVQYFTPKLPHLFGMDKELRAAHSLLAHPWEWMHWFFSKDFMLLPADLARGWQMTMALYGAIAAILLILCFATTRERVAPPEQQDTNLPRDLKDVFTNRSFLVLLGVLVLMLSAFQVKGLASYYYFTYFVHRGDLVSSFLVVSGLVTLGATALAPRVVRKVDKKAVFMASIGIGGVIVAGFWFCGPRDIVAMFTLQIVSSFVIGFNSPIVWAMFADTADDAEWRLNRRNTGLVFAAAIFGTKIGGAIGTWVQGAIMTTFGYVANVQQSTASLVGLKISMSLVPAVMLILAAVIMKAYPLNDGQMLRIEKDLGERKRTST